MNARCADVRTALGVYVVGAIDPAERAFVDNHLPVCPECRDELAGLAGLPALLGRVTLEEVERASSGSAYARPPERLLNSMLAEMASRQRAIRRRNVLVAVAASVVILAGAAGGASLESLLSGPNGTSRPSAPQAANWTTVAGHNAATNVSAEVKFRAHDWGTETAVAISGIKYGTFCTLWATDSSGRRIAIGSWQYREDGAWYPGSVALQRADITGFQITARGKALITLPVA